MTEEQEAFSEETVNEEDDTRSAGAENVLLFLGQSLLPSPEGLSIRKSPRGDSVRLTLQVPSPDLGKVIGKGGRIANAIRAIVAVAGAKSGIETSVEFSDGRRPSGDRRGGRGGGGGRYQGSRPRRRD